MVQFIPFELTWVEPCTISTLGIYFFFFAGGTDIFENNVYGDIPEDHMIEHILLALQERGLDIADLLEQAELADLV